MTQKYLEQKPCENCGRHLLADDTFCRACNTTIDFEEFGEW